MLKRILALILLAVFALAAAGCAANNGPEAAPSEAPTEAPEDNGPQTPMENPMAILDESGNKLGEIDGRANLTAVDGGIFYSVFTMKEFAYTGTAEYHYFDLAEKKDVYLGRLEDQGYEAAFARTELDGVIYALAVTGDPVGDASVPLLLLAFDTANKTMKIHTVSEDGFPYAAMTALGGKLLIMNHETSGEKTDSIYEFDPATEEMKQALSFDASVDSLRSVCAAENGFYLLRLKLNIGGENDMYLDLYDENYGKVSERPVGDLLLSAITDIPSILGRPDAINELGMNVSRFYVADGRYLTYENFGLSRVTVDLETEETVFAKDDNYSFSTGSGAPVLFRLDFDPENVAEPEMIGLEGGKPVRYPFTPDEAHRLVQLVSVSADGTRAILTSDNYPVINASGAVHILPAK